MRSPQFSCEAQHWPVSGLANPALRRYFVQEIGGGVGSKCVCVMVGAVCSDVPRRECICVVGTVVSDVPGQPST